MGNKGSPTYDEDCGRPTTPADPRVASCIRFDLRQAIHLLQHRSSMSHKDSMRLQRRKKTRQGPVPFELASHVVRLINSTRDDPVVHRRGLLERRANQVCSKAPFQPPTQTHPIFPSERVTASPWVKPISWQRPRQRDIDPQARSGLKFCWSDSQRFPGSNPFRGKRPPSKKH